MFDPKVAQTMAKQFVDSLLPLQTLNQDLEALLQQFLQYCCTKMDLLTREEFDIQTQVLAKTRAKLEKMELTLSELESKILSP